jgi:hypothetical protein
VIAPSVRIGRTAIREYIRRAAVIGISWPVPKGLDDAALVRKPFAPAGQPVAIEAAAGLGAYQIPSCAAAA